MKNTITYALLLAYIIVECSAFCIYNNIIANKDGATTTFWLKQMNHNAGLNLLAHFSHSILRPGEKTCCSYQDGDCCKSGKIDEELVIMYRRTSGRLALYPYTFTLPAGGWIEFNGRTGDLPEDVQDYSVDVYYHDGTRYDTKITKEVAA
ncbi:MAG: hypothetical protein EXX96DRAFT_604147 [Benjaminiella poitrasii]|nr:MAG: hypothetical protein EXX96DRAFT_604147 [Benjaminiella poitrasii]